MSPAVPVVPAVPAVPAESAGPAAPAVPPAPRAPVPPVSAAKNVQAVVAGLLLAVTLLSLLYLAFLLVLFTLLCLGLGESPWPLVLRSCAAFVAAGLVLTALWFAPGIRRLSSTGRLLLLGLVACPVPATYALRFAVGWVQLGR